MKEKKLILDDIDYAILKHLQEDGRRSFTEISQDLKVSVGMIRNRYQRLVEQNVLHVIGWTDPKKSGMHAYSRVVIKVRPTHMIGHVANRLNQIQEVSFLAQTTGTYDLEINLLCRDHEHLLSLMQEQIHPLEGVYETSTTMYLKIVKWASHDISLPVLEQQKNGKHSNDSIAK